VFRRAFWFTTGAAAGVWATTKVHRKLRSLGPDALAVRAADKAVLTGHRIKDFALDVRAGMAQREGELNDALGLEASVDADPDRPAFPSQARQDQLGPEYQQGRRRTPPYDKRNEDH
jgi:hypothetical protein